jgi:acyl-CoA synthetase (AMP-forming)/AMP-acid ligase II
MTLVATEKLNVADRLERFAAAMPRAIAVAEPTRRVADGRRRYRTVTFGELAADVRTIAAGLSALGVRRGMRVALLVPPSIDFITLVFALLKSGAVQILIDPGMGKRNLLHCLAEAQPDGFVTIPFVQMLRAILKHRFPQAKLNVTVGRMPAWRGVTLEDVRRMGTLAGEVDTNPSQEPHCETAANDRAAIIFTSGSTGPPKGVLYRHGNFDRQVTEIRDAYDIAPGEIDLPCFPLFGLFNAAMGVTTILPRMNFSRPAAVNPRHIVEAIEQWNVTQSFASPAVWRQVGPFCQKNRLKLRSLQRVMSAGAPVSIDVLRSMTAVLDEDADMHTPYGATEALPVATISAKEVLRQTWRQTEQGHGVCVGGRFPGIEWRVIRITDGPIRSIDAAEELPRGEIGELIVRGDVVTTEYVTRTEANATAKIPDGSTQEACETGSAVHPPPFWHRMGDCGYLDDQDRFWFCGRISQRVETVSGPLYTIPVEAQFNRCPQVARSALVGIGPRGRQEPAIVLEHAQDTPFNRSAEMAADPVLGHMTEMMRQTGVRHVLIYPRRFPVDVRHNAKIGRERLAGWAEAQLKRRRSRYVLLRDLK